MKKSTWIVGSIVVVGVALLVWGGAQQGAAPSVLSDEDMAAILAVRADDWIAGLAVSTSTPEVTLVEYSDYQCPACRQYEPIVNELVEEFGDRLQFVYRHFPLSQIHLNARMAAQTAEAAGMQGAYFNMSALLFEKQSEWQGLSSTKIQEKILEYAEEVVLDIKQFVRDIESEEVSASITQDLQDAARLGLNSTPSFFLNGRKIANPNSYEQFRLLILQELGDITIETQQVGDDAEFNVEIGS